MAADDPALAEYLQQARAQWSETLVGRRNSIEHEGWWLPDVAYRRGGSGVKAREPLVDGLPVTAFNPSMFDRLSCFAEEVTAHLLKRRLIADVTITEVPLGRAARGGAGALPADARGWRPAALPPWEIAYDVARFEET